VILLTFLILRSFWKLADVDSCKYRNSKVDLFLDPQALRNFALSTIVSAPKSDEKSMIHHLPQYMIDGIENILHSTQGTPDRDFRLGEITRALQSVRSFREIGFYALPPYPSILHELYLYYIDGKAFIIALSLLVFIHLNCYAYLYPQPNHPLNVERLFTMAKLCGALIPDHNDEEGVTSVGATSGVRNAFISPSNMHSFDSSLFTLVQFTDRSSTGADWN
jgi:hypothetical protein